MQSRNLAAIFVSLALILPVPFAHAGGVVTVCDEAHLNAAVATGGMVTFACSGTITLSSTIVISANTTIDGSGQAVTISGNNSVQVFWVNSGVTLELRQLGVANGFVNFGHGGAILNGGTLTITNSTFTGNTAAGFFGGAILNSGTLTIANSTFSGNTAGAGGAIFNAFSTLTITNSTFTGNTAGAGGAIVNNGGTLTITSSTFTGNTANLSGAGAIHDANNGTSTIHFTRFVGNTAPTGSAIWGQSVAGVDAINNWWGTNTDPSPLVSGNVTVNPWLVLNVSASPGQINPLGTSTVTADLTHNYAGTDTSGLGHLPDGIPVSFTAILGTISTPVNTLNGKAVTTFTAGTTPGTANVQATVDSATVPTTIRINANASVPAFSQWGVVILAFLLAASAFWVIRRHKRTWS